MEPHLHILAPAPSQNRPRLDEGDEALQVIYPDTTLDEQGNVSVDLALCRGMVETLDSVALTYEVL